MPRSRRRAVQVEEILDRDEYALQGTRGDRMRAERAGRFLCRVSLRRCPLPIDPRDRIEFFVRFGTRLDHREFVAQLASAVDQLLDLEADRRGGRSF